MPRFMLLPIGTSGKMSSSSRSRHVQRELRPGHVGHDQVHEPLRDRQPHGLVDQVRRREAGQLGQRLRADRLA